MTCFCYLLRERGKVFTREDLMQKVWNYDYFGDMRTVDVTVRRLREKIEDRPRQAAVHFNQARRGLLLCAVITAENAHLKD